MLIRGSKNKDATQDWTNRSDRAFQRKRVNIENLLLFAMFVSFSIERQLYSDHLVHVHTHDIRNYLAVYERRLLDCLAITLLHTHKHTYAHASWRSIAMFRNHGGWNQQLNDWTVHRMDKVDAI